MSLITEVWSFLSESCLPVVVTAPQPEMGGQRIAKVGQKVTKKSIGLRKSDRCLSRPCPNLAACSLRHDHTECLCRIQLGRKKCGRGGS